MLFLRSVLSTASFLTISKQNNHLLFFCEIFTFRKFESEKNQNKREDLF